MPGFSVDFYPRPLAEVLFMRCVPSRCVHAYIRGRIVTERNATHEKRIHVGRVLAPGFRAGVQR